MASNAKTLAARTAKPTAQPSFQTKPGLVGRPAKERVLPPVQPNAGIEAAYAKQLVKLVDEMNRSVRWFLLAAYKANTPEMAADETPAAALQRSLKELRRRWAGRFDDLSGELAAYFARDVSQRSDATLRAILKKNGLTVEFKMTAAQRDVLAATVKQNVGLIKSIPEQYFTQVEGAVFRSVQAGRDLGGLTKELVEQHGVTNRRARFIAQDQNNKSTAAFNRLRQEELGIDEAEWRHGGAGKHPRPTHLKAGKDRVRYKIREGWLDPALNRRIWPGTEPSCRCTSRSIIKGFS